MIGKIKKILPYGIFLATLSIGTLTGYAATANQQRYAEKSHIEIQKHESKKARKVLDELINDYYKINTGLSEEEIKESLKCVRFINPELNIQELYIKNPKKFFTKEDVLKQSLEENISSREFIKDSNLNIIQVDFSKIGAYFYGAFYSREYNAIFINKMQKTKEEIIKTIYKQALFEYKEREEGINEEEKYQRIFSLINLLEKNQDDKILPFILKYKKELKEALKNLQIKENINKILTKAALPHEAFHYFYERMFGRRGYNGPGVDELLSLALSGIYKRFGNNDPGYTHIMSFIRHFLKRNIDFNNKEEVKQFSKEITKKYNLIFPPKDYTLEEWQKLTDKEKDNNTVYKTFYNFLNEYWARVYNGACGNTPENIKIKLEKTATQLGDNFPRYNLEDMFHKPFKEELEVIRRMKWNGKPILKEQ